MACSLRPIHCAALQTAGAAPRSSQAVGVPSLLAAPRRARRSCAVAAVRVAASGKKSTQSEEVSAAAQPASSVVMSLAVAAPLLLAAQVCVSALDWPTRVCFAVAWRSRCGREAGRRAVEVANKRS